MAAQQTNIIEILIQAKDQASQQIQGIAASFKSVDTAVNTAKVSLQVFGSTAVTASLIATNAFGGLRDVIQSVRDVLNTDTGKAFLGQISGLADDAINNLAPLSKIIKEINDASRNIGKGITTSQTLEQSHASIFTDTNKKINDALKDSANKFGRALEQNIQNSKINKALEDQIGLGTKELGSLLDTIVADAFLEGIADRAIPNALKTIVNEAFGADLTAIATNSLREAAKTGFLTEISRQLAQGSFAGAIKTFAVGAASPHLEDAQKNIESVSGGAGRSIGRALTGERTEANNAFAQLDTQLGGSATDLIDRLSKRIPEIINAAPLPPIAKLIANRLGELSTTAGKNELQGLGNNISSSLLAGIADKIPADLNLIVQTLKPAFEIQKDNLNTLLRDAFSIDSGDVIARFSGSIKGFASKAVEVIDGGIGLAINAAGGTGGSSALSGLATKIGEGFKSTFGDVLSISGKSAGKSFVEGLKSSVYAEIGTVVDKVDSVLVKGFKGAQQVAPKLQQPADVVTNVLGTVSGAKEPLEVFNLLSHGALKASNAIFEVSQRLAFLSLGFQALQGFVQNGPFDLLIGQNARLQEQLLSTQSSLAATNKVIEDGARVTDPTQAIQKLGPAVDEAIAKIRRDSLELVGITSKDLVGVFQIVSGQASTIGASLLDAANITTAFAAALGTLGLPLYQARQEIVSITTGTIDQNSALAKNLNLNNEMVAKWKAQGTFVKELTTRLEAFKAGNKLAANTVSGITSNIREVTEEIGRMAGQKFLKPIIDELNVFYQYFQKNKDEIAKQVEGLAETLFQAFEKGLGLVKTLAEPFFEIFGEAPRYLIGSLKGFVDALANAFTIVLTVLKPVIGVFHAFAVNIGPLAGILFGIVVTTNILSRAFGFLHSAFGLLFNLNSQELVKGLSEVIFLLDKRTNGVVNTFVNLSQSVGRGSAGFLLLGANINKIPGAAGIAQKELGNLLGGFAPLSGVLLGVLPQLSTFAIKTIGLSKAFPVLGTALQGFAGAVPIALKGLSATIGKSQLFGAFSPVVSLAADSLSRFTSVASDAEKVNTIFNNSLKSAGTAFRTFVGQSALLGIGAFAFFTFFDQLVFKNKGLKKILGDVTNAIRSFADAIASFLGPIISVISTFVATFLGLGEQSNVFNKITGGILAAILVVKLFGGTISSVFGNINKAVAGTFDGIKDSVSRIKNVITSVQQILDPSKRNVKSTVLESDEGKSLTSSRLVGQGKELRGVLEDPTLSPEYRAAIQRQQAQLALDAKALKKDGANAVSPATRKAVLGEIKADAEEKIATAEKTQKKLSEQKISAEQEARKERQVQLDRARTARKELGKVEAIQIGKEIQGTSTPESNKALNIRRQSLTAEIDEARSAADKVNSVETDKLNRINALRDQNTEQLSQYRNKLRKVNVDIADTAEVSAKRIFVTEKEASRRRESLQTELAKVNSDLETTQNPNKKLAATSRKGEIQSELAGLKTYGEVFSDIVDPTKKARLQALADIEKYKDKRKTALREIATVDATTGRSASGRSALGLQNEVKGIDASIAEFEQKAQQLQSPIRKAAKNLISSFSSVISEVAPSFLIGAAFAGITTLVGYVEEQTKLATASLDSFNRALKEGLNKQDILNTSQGQDAAKALQTLTDERGKYVSSIKDPKILENDPTLKLYDQQITKLRELRGLQDKPDDSENKLREKVKKERDNFGTKFVEGVGATGDAIRSGLNVATFGASNNLGLGDRAGNLGEKDVQARLQDTSSTIAKSTEFRANLSSELPKQAGLKEKLIKLEQQKSITEASGDKDGSARADIQIENAKKELSVRKENIETVIKQVQALEGNDVARDAELGRLKKLQEAYQDVNIKIQAIDLPRIGNAIEQATTKYDAALEALKKSAGDPALFKAKLGELLEVSKELQDAGVIRADEAAKNFVRIATNVSADRDLQIKAQQSITEAYQKESQNRVAIYDAQISKTQALLATGKISEAEAGHLTGKLEEKKLEDQLDVARKIARDEQGIRDKRAEEQKSQIQRERDLAEAQLAASQGDPSKIKAVREKQSPQIDKAVSETEASLEEAKKRQKEIEEARDSGKISAPEASDQLKTAKDSVDQLAKQLGSLKEQKGTLEKALQLNEGTQKQLDEVVGAISDADKELESLKKKRNPLKDQFDSLQGTFILGGTGDIEKELKKQDDLIAKKEAEQRERRVKEAQISSIITPDKDKEKLAKNSISSADEKARKLDESNIAQNKKAQENAAAKQLDLDSKLAKLRADNFVKDLDSQIKTTLNAEKVGETQRLAQIAQLRKSGIKLESEIKLQETGERKRSIALELQLEQQKQKEIADLKKKGGGVSDEVKNANLIKVAELTKQLAEAELAAIEGLVSAVRDRLVLESQKYAVTIEQQNLKLERQKLLFTALEKGLENQGRLAESANKLGQSMVALRESEFNALNKIYDRQQAAIRAAGGTGSFADLELEEKKLILAEKLAVIKLNALKQQQKFEAESLERDIQKRDLALERKKVENDIAIAKKKIDIAAQDAAVKSAELEVKLRPQSEEAKLKLAQAKLGQDKNFLELGGLQQEKGFIKKEGEVNDLVSNNDRRSLAITQEGQTNTAIGDVIGATRDPAQQERLQETQLNRLRGNTGRNALTTTDVDSAINAAMQPVNVRGASFKDPASALLGQVEQGNSTLTATPVKQPDNAPFATSFAELARKYPDKTSALSFDELNKKYPDKTAASFDELNKKYPERASTEEPKPEQAIVSSFDKLTQQIDQGFSNVLVAPDLKVKELTAGLEAQFDLVSKKITENPVKLSIDEKRLEQIREEYKKPLAIFDEKQLERLEGIVGALGKGETNIANSKTVGAAVGGNITINAPTTINEAQQKAGNSREEFANVFNDLLKKVGQVTATVK